MCFVVAVITSVVTTEYCLALPEGIVDIKGVADVLDSVDVIEVNSLAGEVNGVADVLEINGAVGRGLPPSHRMLHKSESQHCIRHTPSEWKT